MAEVLIPNRMEFYEMKSKRGAINSISFNSQRDGILLLDTHPYRCGLCLVSIPNGIEFYLTIPRGNFRDGGFQFPTGWNSTLILSYKPSRALSFQFPTGWNSTVSEAGAGSSAGCFNSQRDGILLKERQLPASAIYSFNSQRDGILL